MKVLYDKILGYKTVPFSVGKNDALKTVKDRYSLEIFMFVRNVFPSASPSFVSDPLPTHMQRHI